MLSNKITLSLLTQDWFEENHITEYIIKSTQYYMGVFLPDNIYHLICSCHPNDHRVLAAILNDELEAVLFTKPYPINSTAEDLKSRVHISAADPDFFDRLITELDRAHLIRYATKAKRPD